jgi:hypothetical protein
MVSRPDGAFSRLKARFDSCRIAFCDFLFLKGGIGVEIISRVQGVAGRCLFGESILSNTVTLDLMKLSKYLSRHISCRRPAFSIARIFLRTRVDGSCG